MPRRKLIRQSEFPYHVTSRTNNKSWFNIPMYDVWDICKSSFVYALKKCPTEINSFMLMSNHYHLLITTPNENIDTFMMLFNLNLSKLITKKSGVINHKFSNRYKWTIIDNYNYLLNTYRYIYQNPVRANITQDCHSYPYSSLHFTRFESSMFRYQPHIIYGKEKSWIEKRYGQDFENIMRKSLNKRKFKVSRNISAYHANILKDPTNINN